MLYLPLIISSIDGHHFQGSIMGKRKEKSNNEFTSFTFLDETTPYVVTE